MKLTDISSKSKKAMINKVTESRFGFSIDYNSLTPAKARTMMGKITEAVTKIRNSSAIHTAERNPKYLEMLMVYEGLASWMDERKQLNEGEMGQAETILAAKDMVDTVQDMIEKIGKMQNEQLPALIDSIRDQIGAAQADQYKNSVGQALAGLSTQLGTAREQFDQAARGLTGEQMPSSMPMPGAEPGMDAAAMGIAPEAGMEEPDDFAATDAASGGTAELGREMR